MIKYEIEGGNLPVVICYPRMGQALCTQSGAMSWMSPNMDMQTNSGGGFRKAMGRLFSGDSIFLNEYTALGADGMIAFASSFPGSIIPFELREGNGIIVQKSAKDLAEDFLVVKALLCRKSPETVLPSLR